MSWSCLLPWPDTCLSCFLEHIGVHLSICGWIPTGWWEHSTWISAFRTGFPLTWWQEMLQSNSFSFAVLPGIVIITNAMNIYGKNFHPLFHFQWWCLSSLFHCSLSNHPFDSFFIIYTHHSVLVGYSNIAYIQVIGRRIIVLFLEECFLLYIVHIVNTVFLYCFGTVCYYCQMCFFCVVPQQQCFFDILEKVSLVSVFFFFPLRKSLWIYFQ